jgi:hypothetical protein
MASISVDTNLIFGYASSVVGMMMPIIGISAGFGLGFGLVNKISGMFSHAI